jgi:formylglycine-generating enzyme required for sulfatase activity
LAPVGEFPLGRSFVGALDMVGNAWEWVDADTVTRGGQVRHVIKGGAFNSLPQIAMATYRVTLPDDREQLWNTGFRCAASIQGATRD